MRVSSSNQQSLEIFLRQFFEIPGLALPPISIHFGIAGDLFTRLFRIDAITLGRHVLMNTANVNRDELGDLIIPSRLIVHEAAHVVQYYQRGTVRFLIEYLWDYSRNLLSQARRGDISLTVAYQEIGMEREARLAEAAFLGPETRVI